MKEYLDLLSHIIKNGTLKKNRTGIDTLSYFDYHYRINIQNGFPLLTTKKIKWENILFETLWFLSGCSKIDFLHKHGIHFWDKWEEDGYLPQAYGEYWRRFPNILFDEEYPDGLDIDYPFDQFAAIIKELKTNHNSRRMILTNWYPPSAWQSKLPPCHFSSVFNIQYGKDGTPYLCLHMTQRSCDVPIGVPYNIASYAFLLCLVSHLTGFQPQYFGHTLVDAHIYVDQLDGVSKQLKRVPRDLPMLTISGNIKTLEDLDALIRDGSSDDIKNCFKIIGYNPDSFIKMPVAV